MEYTCNITTGDETIIINNNDSLIDIVGQLQKYSHDNILLIAGNNIRIYPYNKIPKFNLDFIKVISSTYNEYYFYDNESKNNICVIGYDNAKIIMPNIEKFLSNKSEVIIETREYHDCLVHDGKNYNFYSPKIQITKTTIKMNINN